VLHPALLRLMAFSGRTVPALHPSPGPVPARLPEEWLP